MSNEIDIYMKQLASKEDDERYNALQEMMKITEETVSWFDEYKDQFIEKLKDENSYQRSIGIMLLCNLAKNDKKKTFKNILNHMMPAIDDEKFITQRQYLQNIWKVAIVDNEYKDMIVKQLEVEFAKCINKAHYNLLRCDMITSLHRVAVEQEDQKLIEKIMGLIESEEDLKNRKKMMKIMKTEE